MASSLAGDLADFRNSHKRESLAPRHEGAGRRERRRECDDDRKVDLGAARTHHGLMRPKRRQLNSGLQALGAGSRCRSHCIKPPTRTLSLTVGKGAFSPWPRSPSCRAAVVTLMGACAAEAEPDEIVRRGEQTTGSGAILQPSSRATALLAKPEQNPPPLANGADSKGADDASL